MATKKPSSTSAFQTTSFSNLIAGDLSIAYMVDHSTSPFVVLSDESGRAIAQVMGLTLDQAKAFSDQVVSRFNRKSGGSRMRSILMHARRPVAFALVTGSVYALIIAACLFL